MKSKDSKLRKRIIELKKNGLLFNVLGLIPLIWSVALLLMVLWGLGVSVAEGNWYLDHSFSFITRQFDFSNYKTAIEKFIYTIYVGGSPFKIGYWDMFFTSFWYSVGGAAMKMVSTVCFAYAVARFEFPGRKLLYGFIILQMMMPIYGQTAANYSLLFKLGLTDSPLFLLAQGAGHGMFFLITYSFFRNLPTEYEEAAKMDGAGPLRTFIRVMLPLARPVTAALAIMQFIAYWNDYQNPLIYLPSYPTLSSALYLFKENIFSLGINTPIYFAGIFLSIIPVAVAFILFNKQIMENVTIGGLKG